MPETTVKGKKCPVCGNYMGLVCGKYACYNCLRNDIKSIIVRPHRQTKVTELTNK